MGAGPLSSARERILAQAARPRAGEAFADDLLSAVGGVVGFDGWCLLGLDPVSGLRSFMFCRDGIGEPRQLAHNELVENDVHRYVDLARARVPVGLLSLNDRGTAGHSPRLHEIMRPSGMSAELRLALRSRGRLWGALVLFRERPQDAFDDVDVGHVLELADPLVAATRRYSIRPQEDPGTVMPDPGPGVVILDGRDEIISRTPQARAWLSEAVAGGFDEDCEDRVHRSVYEVARRSREGAGELAVSRIRTAQGLWLAVTGSCLEGSDGHVAVVLQRAPSAQLLPAFAAWGGLTRREQDVLDGVVRGLAAKQIARRLHLSPYTVNDHLSSIYRKVGVRGRDELMALLV